LLLMGLAGDTVPRLAIAEADQDLTPPPSSLTDRRTLLLPR
jgi:hypothetical protein